MAESQEAVVARAAAVFVARKERLSHPRGGRRGTGGWFPAKGERLSCCDAVHYPTNQYPWSIAVHCRTAGHVAKLYGVDETELRRAARKYSINELRVLAMSGLSQSVFEIAMTFARDGVDARVAVEMALSASVK